MTTGPSDAADAWSSAGLVPAEPSVKTGDCLGRFTIRACIGAGGMGEVFSAYDPELDRLVAIKVLRPGIGGSSPRTRARFQREAQAMARLNHPNVVSVHDVGTVGERVFVTMELVEGPTLAEWLAQGDKAPRAIVEVFLQAGRGLEAAHAAGIVHRDFKPSNVILGDRVRVVDFGLARALLESESESASEEAETQLDGTITQTGARIGTPAYMAPEQREGLPATQLSDQYAFALTLHEALAHGRPTAAGPSRAIPGWLRAIVERGLAQRPEDRYPSMRDLLVDLGRDPRRARRRWLAAGGVAAAVAAALIARHELASPPCDGAERRLAGIWDEPRKLSVKDAFLATQLAYAGSTWTRVNATLDDYAARWVDMTNQTCRATRVEGQQSDTLMDLRMACLDRRRAVLGALTDLWSHGVDRDALDAAPAVTLPPLAECADARALTERAPMPSDPATAQKIALARKEIDAAQALNATHHLGEAKASIRTARADADATGWSQVRAEAALAEGEVVARLQEPNAEQPLLDAERLGAQAHDDRLVARALVTLVRNLANEHQDAARALTVADIAGGLIDGIGTDARLALELLHYRGDALRTQGKFRAARALYAAVFANATACFGPSDPVTLVAGGRLADAAEDDGQLAEAHRLGEADLAAKIAAFGEDSPRVMNSLNNLGITADHGGDLDAAVGYYRRALALGEKILPPNAVSMANTMNNLAVVELERGELAEAEPLLERARAIHVAAFGPDHPQAARELVNLAKLRAKQGRFAEAVELGDRAIDIKTKAYGPGHPTVALAHLNLGAIFLAQGNMASALASFQRAAAISDKAVGPDHLEALEAKIGAAGALASLGRCGEARPMLADTMARLEKSVNGDHPDIALALIVGARCDLAAGHAAEALAALSRAIAIEESHKVAPVDLGAARWQLARAEAALGRRAAAQVAARQAEKELGADAEGAHERAAVHAWLIASATRAR